VAQLPAFAMVHSLDQWRRVSYQNASLQQIDDDLGQAQLAWLMDERVDNDSASGAHPAGMAFDPWCRLYRALPESGQIERSLWAADNLGDAEPVALFTPEVSQLGDFTPIDSNQPETGPLQNPVDVSVDSQGRLFIAEAGRNRVLIYDLVENKLLRRVDFMRTPIKLATDGEKVWVLLTGETPALAILEGRADPRFETLPDSLLQPASIAVLQGQVYLLDKAGTVDALIMPLANPENAINVAFANDIVFVEGNILIVARRVAEDFLRFEINRDAQSELPHLKARHYDGRGIVVTPDGHVAYWSQRGLRRATLARVRYRTQGTLTSFQLDSGEFQTQWGRLFIDACIPRGTRVTVRCLCLDEVPETTTPLVRTPPDNTLGLTIDRPDLSPMPPEVLLDNLGISQTFYRRHNGREIPWQECADDSSFQTYEAPVIAPAGRYLWLQVEMHGTARLTPKIKSLRAEHHSHDLLRRLPQLYSRDTAVADFLRRYLAIPEGELRELDLRASHRHLLLDPRATPAELLPWLGDFMGMTVDKRWPERAKRKLIENAIWLFRFRGTVMGLKRFIEIYLDSRITIIEHFKVRGLGGALLGEEDALASSSVLGAGFRIGGKLGSEEIESINDVSIRDSISTHAHRFSLIIAASLSDEQQSVVEHLLETHRPAHTLYDICSVDSGMHVGLGLHAGLTSIIGKTSGFGQLQLGASILGHSDVVGIPKMGTSVGNSRLGGDSRAG